MFTIEAFRRPEIMLRKIGEKIRTGFDGPATMLFFTALVLYFPGIWWGATHATAATRVPPWGSDELAPLQPVTELYGIFLARHPVFNPQYPLFQNVMQALFVAPYVSFLWITGRLVHPTAVYPYGLSDPVSALYTMTLLARAMSLVMAAGVVVAAYHTGRVLWTRTAGVITGVLVLTIYPMFYYARTSNVDMGALFWTSLGFLVFAQCLRGAPNFSRSMWLGLFAGLATATKDASWPAFFMMAVVLWYQHFHNHGRAAERAAYKWAIAGLISAAISYVTASGLIFRPSRYLSHLRWITRDGLHGYYRLPPTPGGYLRLSLDLLQNLIDALGAPVLFCVIAGILLSARRDRKMLAWLFPPTAIILLVLVPARYILLRFVMVIAYTLVFFAALLFYQAFKSAGRKAAGILFPVIVGFSVLRGADLTYQMLHDARYELGAWFHQNSQPGARILHFTNASNLPPLDTSIRNIAVGGNSRYVFKRNQDDPEFVLLIPITQFASEPEHERNLPESDYAALRDGSLGYRLLLSLQTKRLFFRRPIPFVNPRLQLFVRKDLKIAE